MKRESSVFLTTALLLSSAAYGQQSSEYPETAPRVRMEGDSTFLRLPPEKQAWVRQTMDRLDGAIKDGAAEAFGRLLLDAVKPQLIGKAFCATTFDEATHLDVVETSSTAQAFAVRWLDKARGATFVHTAIFTEKRCVVHDGDLVDGKRILRVLPNSLAVSYPHGLVAYEALYFDPADDGKAGPANRRGVFIDDRFLVDLDPLKASSSRERNRADFWFALISDQLEVRPEIRMGAVSGRR
jgi:hypothetical protein